VVHDFRDFLPRGMLATVSYTPLISLSLAVLEVLEKFLRDDFVIFGVTLIVVLVGSDGF